jgi:hypothetical protein
MMMLRRERERKEIIEGKTIGAISILPGEAGVLTGITEALTEILRDWAIPVVWPPLETGTEIEMAVQELEMNW